MAIKIQTVLDVFHEAVPASFGFLVDELGYVMTRDDDYAFTAASQHGRIVVELDWGSIAVSVRPSVSGRAVRLAFIVGATDPDVLFLPRYPWGPDEARDEIERQAALLRKYCWDLLSGDTSRWGQLEEHQKAVLDQWKTESERLVREARSKLVRRRAEAAYGAKRYAEAVQMWASIADDLDDAERRKLEYARRRLVMYSVPRRPRLEGIA